MRKSLLSFLAICVCYSSFAQLTSTNLPIAIVDFTGTLTDSVQLQGTLKLIDNASGTNTPTDAPKFNGMVGLRYKGNLAYPKKSFNIETWSAPNISLDTSLLNMPSENDWLLLSSYEDRSLARYFLSTKTVERMGRYAPRLKFCELILNGQYQGIYLFGEKIKRDTFRVDIAKLTNIDISGNNLTGGYILTVDGGGDGWTSAYPPLNATTQTLKIQIDYPSPADILPVQQNYIKSYVDSFEVAMNAANFQDTTLGWRRFAGVNSMVDFMIINEVFKDVDAYRKNAYLYKDKGNKLRFGPIAGQDVAWKNTSLCNAATDTGWAYKYGSVCDTSNRLVPFWWNKVTSDTAFMRELKCSYSLYRQPGYALDTVKLFGILDSVNTYLNAQNAISRNFTKWPIWGVPIVNEPTPMAANYSQEIANMKAFIKGRLQWLDTKWYITSGCAAADGTSDVLLQKTVNVYPNPANNLITVEIQTPSRKEYDVIISSIQGSIVLKQHINSNRASFDISSLVKGMYFVQIKAEGKTVTKKIIKH